MAKTGVAPTRNKCGGAENINRTFLFWEEEDISKLS